METRNLELVEFYVEFLDQVFEKILVVGHQLASYFFSQHFVNVNFRGFEVGEKKNENLFCIPRDLYQVNLTGDVVEVSIENFPCFVNAKLVVPNLQRRRPPLCNQTNLVRLLFLFSVARVGLGSLKSAGTGFMIRLANKLIS